MILVLPGSLAAIVPPSVNYFRLDDIICFDGSGKQYQFVDGLLIEDVMSVQLTSNKNAYPPVRDISVAISDEKIANKISVWITKVQEQKSDY